MAYASDEFEIQGATDVQKAIAWAEKNAGNDRTYTLYVVVVHGEDVGLVHLLGVDPNK